MGHFTEDTLQRFQAMCAEGLDFGEGPIYDFAMCIKASGEIYGVSRGEVCREGKPISEGRAKSKQRKKPDTRMAKLKAAFIKKTGREMRPDELKKLQALLESGALNKR